MENNISIEEYLNNQSPTLIIKTKASRLSGITLLVVGIIIFSTVIFTKFHYKSMIPPFLIIISTVLLILGLWKTFIPKEFFISAKNKKRLKVYEFCFDRSESRKLVEIFQNGNFEKLSSLKKSTVGALKIRILATDDNTLCFSQVIGYESNEYKPLTEIKQHHISESEQLMSL